MSIYGGGRGRKRRQIGASGEAEEESSRMNVENRKGHVVDWSVRFLAAPRPAQSHSDRTFLLHPPAPTYLFFFPLGRPLSVSSTGGAPSSSSVHFSASALSFSPGRSLRDIWIVGSHLPHYHTNRPLAHSDTAFILCPTHLRARG